MYSFVNLVVLVTFQLRTTDGSTGSEKMATPARWKGTQSIIW